MTSSSFPLLASSGPLAHVVYIYSTTWEGAAVEWARGLHGRRLLSCFIPPLYCFTTASLLYGKELDLSGREARHDFAVHPRLPLLQQREKMLKLLEREGI